MITTDDIVNLLFSNGYYSRKYLNDLPRVAEWVRQNTTCYVEQVGDNDEHVVVWPSPQVYNEYIDRARANAISAAPSPKGNERTLLQRQLQTALEDNDFVTVSRIKQQMKGIK